jgi:tetratricopeptide (TPR) repeat protein
MSDSLGLAIDEDARRRFEAAWRLGPADLAAFLPDRANDQYLGTLVELVLIDFEMRGKSESSLRLEDYLRQFPELAVPTLLKPLLEEEYRLRHRHGDRPELGEYRERFPDLNWTQIRFDTLAETPRDIENAFPKIPGLEFDRVLGQGGMGVVYCARQTSLDRTVAVKQVLSSSGIIPADDLARFKNEALAVARLGHPNIVQVYEIGEELGRPFLILEYMEGGTLAGKLHGTPQPPHAAAAMVQVLAKAVQAVHDAGFLHRDLKPGNILLSKDGTLKISDFGLTKRVSDLPPGAAALTQSGAIVGTPNYMAPEQASGRNREVGPPADTYALGAILYEMLTGRPPFQGQSPMDTVMQVVSQEPVAPRRLQPRVPADLETICMKCLEKDPRRRYESAAALADDLGRFLTGDSIRARPVGSVERSYRWCQRHPAQAALASVIGVIVVASAIGGVVWRASRLERQRLDLEETRKIDEAQARHRDQIRTAAEHSMALAKSELHAGRFVAAREFLRQSRDPVQTTPGLEELAKSLNEQFGRVDRLVTFSQRSDLAERQAFLENDGGALEHCEAALKALGVLTNPDSWWQSLPNADLRPEQAAKLERDAAHQLLLFSLLTIKDGKDDKSKRSGDTTTRTLDLLKLHAAYRQAKGLPESMTGRILEGYCYASQFRFDKIRRLNGSEPESASDCYFIGIAMFWAAQQPDDWISRAVTLTFPLLGVSIGEPKQTAERLLRRAVADDSAHYWSHFWLGWCLIGQADLAGSELAFSSCVTLRPEEGLAYAERARVLAFSAARAKDGPVRDGLVRRATADADRATRFSPGDWYVQHLLIHTFVVMQKQREASAAAGRLLELITLPHLLPTRSRAEQESLLKELALIIDFRDPVDPGETQSLLALVCVFMKKDDEALRRVDQAEKLNGNRTRIHLVRGIVSLRRKEIDYALSEFDAALRETPGAFLATAGRARALELKGDHVSSLIAYRSLHPLNDGQRLAACLGCHRNLLRLGRTDEADQFLRLAREIDPNVAP